VAVAGGAASAERHPEWLHAYIGAAQGIDAWESKRRGWAWTMKQVRAAKKILFLGRHDHNLS
jgi:hypothetical protein